MGTTSIKNAMQYEVLPTSTVSTTSGSQFMNKTFLDATYIPVQISASFTGTLASTVPFSCNYTSLVVNGTFVSQMKNLTLTLSATEAGLLTLNLDTAVMTDTVVSLTAAALTSFSAPSLKYITAAFTLTANAMTTFSLPVLTVAQGAFTLSASTLTTLSLPQLAYCPGGLVLTCAALTTLSLAAIVEVSAASTFTMVNMTNVTIGSTLKKFTSNFVISGAKLTQTSVDNILVSLAALDGTNGTTAYSSRTVTLSGGTSSAPSATGLAAKTTLQGRGCTVTTN